MAVFSSFLLFIVAFVSYSQAAIQTTGDLTISNVEVSPDGYTRTAVLAGDSVVGTLITGNTGDNFQINVVNNLNDDNMLQSTSVHWHGMFMASGENWNDGGAFVNQCPIAKGNSFLYNFDTNQAGTFWYHSHLSTQYCDGLRGPFVIYDSSDPHADLYDVDDESTIITLMDWYHDYSKTLTFPTPDSTLINGLGRWSDDPTSDLAVIEVTSGSRYRFRLINLSCDPNYVFAIQGHTMTIIEVDSVNVEPYEVDEIQIFAGQRFSFVLNANQDVDNYWIRAQPSVGVDGFDDGINSAILRYTGADDSEPAAANVTSSNAMLETSLVPLTDAGSLGGADDADYKINLALGFDLSTFLFTVNGATFTSPTVPVLLQILSGAQAATDLLPSGNVLSIPGNSIIELSMPSAGLAGGPHPFHLHGHTFDVIRAAGSDVYNYANPPRRDVVSIGAAGDNVTIRWKTDNPGPWFLHCHIDWHLEAGLAVVMAEDIGEWNSTITPSTAWDELCPIYNALDSADL
ncbi:multicopper oxidase [Cylindrobasidium torrendii FP15055 ss-10]|uniref:Multicopper oxidase n=1 Tax=Cylindrobasidium torrendii FP15055 ss-10 TaxID=1314674 RepID=A0A0D7BLX7_9AGAR|nr:multicopper oxidase [Cylindrobasidium torrendii FP15055 ss-10]